MTGHTGYITHARKVTKPLVEQKVEPAPKPEPAAENSQAETEPTETEPEPTENLE